MADGSRQAQGQLVSRRDRCGDPGGQMGPLDRGHQRTPPTGIHRQDPVRVGHFLHQWPLHQTEGVHQRYFTSK